MKLEVIDICDDNSREDEISSSNSPGYSAPPPKKFKSNHSPIMYSNLISSNFIYYQTKHIKLPINLPKIKNLPVHSIPNVRFQNIPHFLANFSSCSPSRSLDTNLQLKKLRKQIPSVLYSKIVQPKPLLHANFLVKPKEISLITEQELAIPDVYCPECTVRSASCLNCKYLASETSPTDQMNLNILRESVRAIVDPKNDQKHVIEIDYKFSLSPFLAFRPEISNSNIAKNTSIALLKRLQKNDLVKEFHTKMTEGMQAGHSIFLNPENYVLIQLNL